MEYESLKGFRDFYPDEQAARRQVFDSVRETARSYGFDEVAAPSLEPLSLYEVKSGEEIVEETYSFEDKGGRRVTMTPELTPSLVRMYVARQQEMSKPVRWFALPKLWRYEQPQSGRLREFYQPNFDIFGAEGVEADAEVIATADSVLKNLGLTDEYELRVSHRGIVEGLVDSLGLEDETAEAVHRIIDKSERINEGEIRERLSEVGLDENEVDDVVFFTETRGWDEDDLNDARVVSNADEAVDRLSDLRDALDAHGVETVFDPSIVRGMDYYTGVVFECFDTDGDLRAIFGGGRYDDLVWEFGGPDTPAVGFGLGDATLELLMKQSGVWPGEETAVDYYVAVIGDVRETATRVAQSLRDDGNEVRTNLREGRSFTDQLEHADSSGATKTVIVGERDLAENEVTVKDMRSGDQEQVPLEEFV